jgi:hypothetical protein
MLPDEQGAERKKRETTRSQPVLLHVAPRFVVQDLLLAPAFYRQPGFTTTYQDEGFAIVE